MTGRYVVDIEGCLRTTDRPFLTARDIAALHGRIGANESILWERKGEPVLLEPDDRVELEADQITSFRAFAPDHACRISPAATAGSAIPRSPPGA
jgi:hypothetical protein